MNFTPLDQAYQIHHGNPIMYNSNQILTSPPLFRIKYANLILAGEETREEGVLCYINSFSANPVMETNKVSYRLLTSNSGSAGGPTAYLGVGAYPNIFDVSIGFTILNENLAQQQVEGILNKRYFYNYQTSNGPRGGHGLSSGELQTSVEELPITPEQKAEANADLERIAAEQAVLQGNQ